MIFGVVNERRNGALGRDGSGGGEISLRSDLSLAQEKGEESYEFEIG
jgi:hypothetical protein